MNYLFDTRYLGKSGDDVFFLFSISVVSAAVLIIKERLKNAVKKRTTYLLVLYAPCSPGNGYE